MELKWRHQRQEKPEWTNCGKIMKPVTLDKASNIADLTGLAQGSLMPRTSEDVRATRAHQLEADRTRSIAVIYSRRNMIR